MELSRLTKDRLHAFYDALAGGEIVVDEHVHITFFTRDTMTGDRGHVRLNASPSDTERGNGVISVNELENMLPHVLLDDTNARAEFSCTTCGSDLSFDTVDNDFVAVEHVSCSGEYCEDCDTEFCDGAC